MEVRGQLLRLSVLLNGLSSLLLFIDGAVKAGNCEELVPGHTVSGIERSSIACCTHPPHFIAAGRSSPGDQRGSPGWGPARGRGVFITV